MYNNTICHNIVSLLKQPSCLWSPSPSSLYLMKGVFKMSSWNGPIKCLLHIPFIFSLTSIGQLCGVDCWETDSVGATSPCYYDNFHFSVLLSCFCYWSRSSLRGTRGTSLESGRLQSLKRKKRDNKESTKKKKKPLIVTLSSYAKSLSISLHPVGFNSFTRGLTVPQTHFPLAEKHWGQRRYRTNYTFL